MKNLTQSAKDALNSGHVNLVVAMELDIHASVIVRVHSGIGTLTIDSNTYTGVGDLGKVSAIEQTGDAKPNGITAELSGIDNQLLIDVMNYHYQGRSAKMHVVLLDSENSIIDTHTIFTGKIDTMSIKSGETSTITVKIENRLVDWIRADNSKYTQEDYERSTGATDGFYQYLAEVINKSIDFTPYQSWRKQ